MTYAMDGRQYVAVASGNDVIAFALLGAAPGEEPSGEVCQAEDD
jgi:hypothetical protein